MSSYSYKVERETTSPRGGTYSTTYSTPSYSSPHADLEFDAVRDFDIVRIFHLTHTDFGSHMVLAGRVPVRWRNFFTPYTFERPWEQGRSYHSSYMTPSVRTSRYVPPPRTTSYTSYSTPSYRGRSYLRGIPSVAHQRLSPVSAPAYSSPLMPYLLMDEDDIVVLPRRRHYGRVHEELDDDPVLQWYEDRIHHAQAEAIAHANKRVADLCTPRVRHISTAPPYIQGRYKEPLPAQYKHSKYRPPVTAALKPVRSNIEIKSHFSKAHNAADHEYRRMGDGRLACVSLLGGCVVSKRKRSRFYRGQRALAEVDMCSPLTPLPSGDDGQRRSSGEAQEDQVAE